MNEITTLPRFAEMTAQQFQMHLDQRSVNTHDAAAVARWFTEDAVQLLVTTGEAARGRDAIRDRMAEFFLAFPDVFLEVRDLFSVGQRMCVQIRLNGTHEGEFGGIPPTGRRVEADWCLVFRFDADGLVEEEVVYSDMATLLRQLGVLPDA